uniref:Uncharacterized protein n=1 Tax=Trichinella nativa TaxID=6335 RepID=A0A0V1KIB2_9BILA
MDPEEGAVFLPEKACGPVIFVLLWSDFRGRWDQNTPQDIKQGL